MFIIILSFSLCVRLHTPIVYYENAVWYNSVKSQHVILNKIRWRFVKNNTLLSVRFKSSHLMTYLRNDVHKHTNLFL